MLVVISAIASAGSIACDLLQGGSAHDKSGVLKGVSAAAAAPRSAVADSLVTALALQTDNPERD
jgi:hypothetical protein